MLAFIFNNKDCHSICNTPGFVFVVLTIWYRCHITRSIHNDCSIKIQFEFSVQDITYMAFGTPVQLNETY